MQLKTVGIHNATLGNNVNNCGEIQQYTVSVYINVLTTVYSRT